MKIKVFLKILSAANISVTVMGVMELRKLGEKDRLHSVVLKRIYRDANTLRISDTLQNTVSSQYNSQLLISTLTCCSSTISFGVFRRYREAEKDQQSSGKSLTLGDWVRQMGFLQQFIYVSLAARTSLYTKLNMTGVT